MSWVALPYPGILCRGYCKRVTLPERGWVLGMVRGYIGTSSLMDWNWQCSCHKSTWGACLGDFCLVPHHPPNKQGGSQTGFCHFCVGGPARLLAALGSLQGLCGDSSRKEGIQGSFVLSDLRWNENCKTGLDIKPCLFFNLSFLSKVEKGRKRSLLALESSSVLCGSCKRESQ